MSHRYDTIIVGAGLAGLACARQLHDIGQSILLVDKRSEVGGRLATDEIDGFRMDRGFQVLNTAYETAQKLLDFDALNLGYFSPGARLISPDGSTDLFYPLRVPSALLKTLFSNAGSLTDK